MNQVQYIGLQSLMKTLIFNSPCSNNFPSTNLVFCEAPTSRAPTLSCQSTNIGFKSTNSKDTNPSNYEAPTPRDSTLSFQGTNLFCSRLQHLGHQPSRLQPTAIFCLDMFDSNSLFPKSSSLNYVNLQLQCYINNNLSSYEGAFTTLHISQIESKKLPHDYLK